jgi:hypothetical protein
MNLNCKTKSGQKKKFEDVMKGHFTAAIDTERRKKIAKDPILNRLYNEKSKTKCTDYIDLINQRLLTIKTKSGTVDQNCQMKCLPEQDSRMSSDDYWPLGFIHDFEMNNSIYKDKAEFWIGYHINSKKKEFADCKGKYNDGEEEE